MEEIIKPQAKEGISISGKVMLFSHPAGTHDRYNELKDQSRIYKKRSFLQWLLRRPATFSHFDEAKLAEARELIAAGTIAVEQKNLIVGSSGFGIDIIIQYLLSGYTGINPFPLGIAWGEIGTGSTTPALGDTALTAPTNRAPVAYAIDYQTNTAQLQFFFPDNVLANGIFYEAGSFIGGTSTIGTGSIFNHALFATPYSKSSGTDTTLEIDFYLHN